MRVCCYSMVVFVQVFLGFQLISFCLSDSYLRFLHCAILVVAKHSWGVGEFVGSGVYALLDAVSGEGGRARGAHVGGALLLSNLHQAVLVFLDSFHQIEVVDARGSSLGAKVVLETGGVRLGARGVHT